MSFQAGDICRMERRIGPTPGDPSRLRPGLQGPAQRQLWSPLRGHHLLRLFHHHQLHDCHQHVHRHHSRELQPGLEATTNSICSAYSL